MPLFRSRSAARSFVLQAYAAALRAVHGQAVVAQRLRGAALAPEMLPNTQPLAAGIYVVAIGKAATAMMAGAQEALAWHMDGHMGSQIAGGLLITKQGHADWSMAGPRLQVLEAEHPVPGAGSLVAGQALLDFLAAVPAFARLVFLISGGTSALAEVLPAGVGLEQLQRVNAWLLGSGLDIGQMNRVRRALSQIKGGRLARYLRGQPVLNLLISDVPGDDPAVIGSGLLVPPPHDDWLTAAERARLPGWLNALLEAPAPPEAALFDGIRTEILCGNADALAAAVAYAQGQGVPVFMADRPLQGDALEAGRRLAAEVLSGPPGLYVWGGETTVVLPGKPGRGGRCQSLALAAAGVLAGSQAVLLAAGTDGTDGPGEDAGALVDGQTVLRGGQEGFRLDESLRRADAGAFLHASGDLLHTGPTGSNVMDVVLAYRPPES